ncbi:MAG: hypothetical protein JSU70_00795 [Phycisphaerales bacterium]|nr:MAG: hypothetical protein JSU70_00795 [Phycisphaerales bacterium]
MNGSLKWMLAISLVLTTTAMAQPLEQSDIIVAGSSSAGVWGADGMTTLWTLNLRGGYMVTPEIEVGGMFMASWGGVDTYTIAAYGAYNFVTIGPENLVPYAGLFIGYIDPGFDDGWVWGPMVGVKWFPFGADNIFIWGEYQYQDIQDIAGASDAHQGLVGLGVLLP